MALSANKSGFLRKVGDVVSEYINVAATASVIYLGALVNRDATYKGVQPATSTNGDAFAGVAVDYAVGAAGSAAIGTETVQVYKTGIFSFATGGSTTNGPAAVSASDVGCEVYIEDDATVGKSSGNGTACYVKCGILTEYISATDVRVKIDGYCF